MGLIGEINVAPALQCCLALIREVSSMHLLFFNKKVAV